MSYASDANNDKTFPDPAPGACNFFRSANVIVVDTVVYNVDTKSERPMGNGFLGEFEQMVLLAILQQAEDAFGLEVRREIERSAGRSVSRSAFYTTLERLEQKGYVVWEEATPDDSRRTAPLRRFRVTDSGLETLRVTGRAWKSLWRGLEDMLEEA